jgi:hypothetical protein
MSPCRGCCRVLFLASYFAIFEYTVLSRSYTLGLFLVVAFLVVYDPRRVRLWPLSAILSVLAATSVYGLFLAFALALPVFLGRIRIWRTTYPLQFGFYMFQGNTCPPSVSSGSAHCSSISQPRWQQTRGLVANCSTAWI